ncbi:uncharacterized protein BDR25DRAFT_371081 [Lindgomyces ingoldianus]|uniref:Uncharacterized protein n=1 Tax=Lindgomyces ingoldianus TaxID=673940 RepID=A0ACB6RCR7_9PLEO|nr:uncharacterized protein BDR25DRAFT_371081 [Lindgomyces ingoldianus]KAF2477124.1 hypothetical protein BDR25DRAFT_371081 [Lindgomyces ingoldianus]
MRPIIDKDPKVDLDQLFEDHVETDLLQKFSDNAMEPSSPDNLAHLFELPSSNDSFLTEDSNLPDWDRGFPEAWHKAPWDFKENPASPIMPDVSFSIYPESRGKASVSDPGLFKFDDSFELDSFERRLSLSTPPSPKPQFARPAQKATPTPDQSVRYGVHKLRRKPNFPMSMMQPSHYRTGVQDIWTRKLEGPSESFNLRLPPNVLPSSPPLSTKPEQNRNGSGFYPRDRPYMAAMSSLPTSDTTSLHNPNYQLTPLSSPAIDTSSCQNSAGNPFQFSESNENMATGYISHNRQMSNEALSALHTPPSHRLVATWGPDTPVNLNLSFPGSPEFHTPNPGKTWWSNEPAQPGSVDAGYHASQQHSCAQNQNAFSTASAVGLGITCDTASFTFSDDADAVNGHSQSANGNGSFSVSASASSFETNTHAHMQGYTPIYPPSPPLIFHGLSNTLPQTTPQSRTPSPTSPSQPQPHFTRTRASTYHHRQASHTQSHSNSFSQPQSHRRKSSNSSSTHNPSSQTKLSTVGFVNFTPSDSQKILTGVAPSGSSKTKARREKEAAEKRRKFSQAAVKAVIEAGGDLGRLEREGLLCLDVGMGDGDGDGDGEGGIC